MAVAYLPPDADGTSATITIDGTNNTLQSFADAINQQNIGVTANVVRIDENSYALSLISPTGEAPANARICAFWRRNGWIA